MGTDKAGLRFGGRPFWKIQTSLLRDLRLSPLLVVGKHPPPWLPRDFYFLEDDPGFPDSGPLAGFAALGRRLSTGICLTLGIDYPALPRNWLLEQIEGQGPEEGWIPEISGHFLPFVASYPVSVLREAAACLEHRQLRVLSWVQSGIRSGKLRTIKIDPEAAEGFANVNHPGDVERLQKDHESSS